MKELRWTRWSVALAVFLFAGCGGPRDPVREMQKSLSAAPDYMIILEDMRQEGSFFVDYFHRYKVTQGDRSQTTNWVEVTESTYKQYEPFLGMALVAKTDQGVNNTPHPAGYHYVGNPQYGSWNQGSGGSFWVFYGQYSLMRNMMGYGGRSIYRNDYNDYRTSSSRRQPYYGRNKEWGTSGSVTQKQKPSFYQRRKQRLANRQSAFSQKARNRAGRSRSGFGSRSRGGFGK
jgi:hypothetical protein